MGPEGIKNLRLSLGWSQERMAREIGVSFSTVNRWERGRSEPSPLALNFLGRLSAENLKNKRCAPRFDARCPVEFRKVKGRGPGLEYLRNNSHTENVSCGGLMFRTAEPLRVGEALDLNLMAKEFVTNMMGEVVWVNGTGSDKRIGFRFHKVTHQELATIIDTMMMR